MNTVGNHSEDGTGEWRPQKEWGEGAEGSEKYDGNDNNQYIIINIITETILPSYKLKLHYLKPF